LLSELICLPYYIHCKVLNFGWRPKWQIGRCPFGPDGRLEARPKLRKCSPNQDLFLDMLILIDVSCEY
jgi:hypothetical protein